MNSALSWSQILKKYRGQWVELTDVEWDWKSAFPSRASVRNADTDRGLLLNKIKKCGEQSDSVVLYLGAVRSTIDFAERISAC